ncbi:MAG: CocE/NonD family hydrolase [Gemmatimonadota bacterium]
MNRSAGVLLLVSSIGFGPGLTAQQPGALGACSSPPITTSAAIQQSAVYVPMSDGVRLAVDVFLPKDRGAERLPTVFISTRYWRAREGQQPSAEGQFWLARGYAFVYADVRGTGASFGQWFYPWSPQEVKDIGALVRWVARQPWSNGRVGAIGTSYTANTAQLAAVYGGPSLKAVIPRFMDFDFYADLVYMGGVVNRGLIEDWGKMVHSMDMNDKVGNPPKGVRPVDADQDGKLLAAVVTDHKKNPPLNELVNNAIYRDDIVAQYGGVSNDEGSTYRWKKQIELSKVPIFGWASWLDAGTSQGLINRYLNWSNPQTTVIGPWSHGGGFHTSQFRDPATPTEPSRDVQNEQAACFFDRYVKGAKNGFDEPGITYFTEGEETWKKTKVWPIPGTKSVRWYLGGDHSLTSAAPTAAGTDEYKVDFEATTGTHNRWYTQLGGADVVYPDRTVAGAKLLTYLTPPLERDVEVTGQAVVTLQITSTATDGNFIAYLEDVDPAGKVTYVTEGMLRALHRKISTGPQPYRTMYPYHSYLKKDGQPLVPGETATLTFQLIPTSVLFKQGHRIRLGIAGHDKDTFLRLPAEGDVTITVGRNRDRPSFIDLPVVPR